MLEDMGTIMHELSTQIFNISQNSRLQGTVLRREWYMKRGQNKNSLLSYAHAHKD